MLFLTNQLSDIVQICHQIYALVFGRVDLSTKFNPSMSLVNDLFSVFCGKGMARSCTLYSRNKRDENHFILY